ARAERQRHVPRQRGPRRRTERRARLRALTPDPRSTCDARRFGGVSGTVTPMKLAAVLLALAALAAPAALAASPRAITVNGAGMVSTTPNQGDFSYGVTTTGGTASAALSSNARLMNRVIAALKAHGISAADIQTAEVSLSPNRNQNGDKILNYTASNSVSARVKPLSKAGPVVDAAVTAGANEVSGPSLTASDARVLSQRALKAGVADARARAQAIASAAGVRLGRVLTVTESSSSPVPLGAEKAFSAAADTPIEAGTVQIDADVT